MLGALVKSLGSGAARGATKGAVKKKITGGVKAKTTKVSKEKLLGRGDTSTSMSAPTSTSSSVPKPTVNGSTSVSGDPLQSINQSLTKIQSLLKGSLALDKSIADQKRKQREQEKAKVREGVLETRKPEEQVQEGGGGGRQMSFMDSIINFLLNVLLGFLAVRAIKYLPQIKEFMKSLEGVVNTIESIAGTIFNGLVNFIDWGYQLYDNFRGWVGNTFGEEGLKTFDELSEHLNTFLNATLIACLAILKFKGVGGLIGVVGKIGGGVVSAGKALVGFVAGGGAAAAAIVAGVGLLASGLGEGAFQLRKMGKDMEDIAREEYDVNKNLLPVDPRRVISFIKFKGAQLINAQLLTVGTLLDIVGAPFRYAVELIRYPFLSDQGRRQQRKNLAKFDSRVREQVRQGLSMLTLGLFDMGGEGSWGSLFGDPDNIQVDEDESNANTRSGGNNGLRSRTSGQTSQVLPSGGVSSLNTDPGDPGQIYLHWTVDSYNKPVGGYHTVITGDGKFHQQYAYNTSGGPKGHTYGRNSKGVSLSAAAMLDYDKGARNWPKPVQLESMAKEAARIAKAWGWTKSDITNKNVLTHGEAGSNVDGNVMHTNYGPYGRGAPAVKSIDGLASGGRAAFERWDMDKLASDSEKYGEGAIEMRRKIKGFMAKGGPTIGKGLYVLAERGREFIIDADSTAALEAQVPGFLYELNKAKGREAVNVLRAYASYESGSDQTIVIPMPAMAGGSSSKESFGNTVIATSAGSENNAFDTLYKGA